MSFLSQKFQKLQTSLSLGTTPLSKRHDRILDILKANFSELHNMRFYEREDAYKDMEEGIIDAISFSEKGESRAELTQHVCNSLVPYGLYPSPKFVELLDEEKDRYRLLGVFQNMQGFADDAHKYLDTLSEDHHVEFIKSTIDNMDLSGVNTDKFTRTVHRVTGLIERCEPEQRPDMAFLAIQRFAQAQVVNAYSFNRLIALQSNSQNNIQDVEYVLERLLENNHMHVFDHKTSFSGVSEEEMDECRRRVLARNESKEQGYVLIEDDSASEHTPL